MYAYMLRMSCIYSKDVWYLDVWYLDVWYLDVWYLDVWYLDVWYHVQSNTNHRCSVLRALCSVLRVHALCGTVLLSILRGVLPGRRGTVLYLCTSVPQPRYKPPWACATATFGVLIMALLPFAVALRVQLGGAVGPRGRPV